MKEYTKYLIQEFVKLLRESIILQGTLSVLVVSVWLFLIMTDKAIPGELHNIVGLVIGFFFGGKVALAKANNSG